VAKIISALAVLLMAAGCFSFPKPNYIYSQKEKDPVLIFNSDFALVTFFSVNINPLIENSCEDFRLAGHIKNEDPFYASGEQIQEFKIQVPAGQAVTVRAMYDWRDADGNGEYCGPLYQSFTPRKGATYRVRMGIRSDEEMGPRFKIVSLYPPAFTYAPPAWARVDSMSDPDKATIIKKGVGGFLNYHTPTPYGDCHLRITDDGDKTPVKGTRGYRTCKPTYRSKLPPAQFKALDDLTKAAMTRTYKGFTQERLLEAAEKALRHSDKDFSIISNYPHRSGQKGLWATRRVFDFIGVGFHDESDVWFVELDGPKVTVSARFLGSNSLILVFASPEAPWTENREPYLSPPLYGLFFDRMEYFLG
jgi:hypothetical protein